jgi:pimeloyl-ACP methyl ester carboxylesterase
MKDFVQAKYNPLKKINPFDKTGHKTEVPAAVAKFQIDLLPPKDFVNKYFNIIRWTELPKGGHFAAMEQPELLANDLREFVNQVQVPKDNVLESMQG